MADGNIPAGAIGRCRRVLPHARDVSVRCAARRARV
jgi:hypothetical protein